MMMKVREVSFRGNANVLKFSEGMIVPVRDYTESLAVLCCKG